jgi:hypothetical protein
MTDELPPALGDLRDQLREAAARDIEIERRVAQRVHRGRGRQWLLVAGAAIVTFAGVAVAQRAFDREGPAPPEVRDLPSPIAAAAPADPGLVVTSASPDPAGGPPWALRVFTNPTGLACVALGRMSGGVLGIYDASHTFRPLPARVGGACERLDRSGLLVAVQRRASPQPRTIVYGLARDDQPVRITIAGKTHAVRPGGLGSFIDVRPGLPDMHGATAWTTVAGRRTHRRLG